MLGGETSQTCEVSPPVWLSPGLGFICFGMPGEGSHVLALAGLMFHRFGIPVGSPRA